MTVSPHTNAVASRWLIVVAAPREVRAVLDGLGASELEIPEAWSIARMGSGFDVLYCGVGKSNAAGATARHLDLNTHCGVLSVGIAGALPGSGLGVGDVVGATCSVFADEGIGADSGFIPMSDAGFGAFPDGSMHATHDPDLLDQLNPCCTHSGPIATVSWCSGSDACAQGVVNRTGAICEAMEGSGVALAARRLSPALHTAEIRVISNTTGDRASQKWALDDALTRLSDVLGRFSQAVS